MKQVENKTSITILRPLIITFLYIPVTSGMLFKLGCKSVFETCFSLTQIFAVRDNTFSIGITETKRRNGKKLQFWDDGEMVSKVKYD